MSKRQNLILQFVGDNIETSQYKVIKHLVKSGNGTQNTIIKDIHRLMGAGRLVERGNEYNLRLCINREDQYVRINQMLSKIEKCIVKMNVPIRKIIELKPSLEDGTMIIINHKESTMFPYVESFSSILWYLLELVSSTKFSKEDSQLLHIRIIELIVKIRNQYYDLDNSKEITKKAIMYNTNKLIRSRDEFKNNICSDKTYDSLIMLNKEFEKEFLS